MIIHRQYTEELSETILLEAIEENIWKLKTLFSNDSRGKGYISVFRSSRLSEENRMAWIVYAFYY